MLMRSDSGWFRRLPFVVGAAGRELRQRIAREYRPPAWADTAAAIHRVVLHGHAPESGQ